LKARERRFNRSVDSGAPNREFHQLRRTERLVASRNKRTGSNIPVDEEFDTYDIVLEFLCVEGYAETLEDAEWIMVNQLTQEDIESILEGYQDFPTAKVLKKAGNLMGSSAGKNDPTSKKKEARGIKMMDTMMQHTPDR